MAECEKHPDRQAEAECAGCGRQLCPECVEARQEELAYCYDCAVNLEVDGFKAKDERQQEKRQKKARRISTPVIVMAAIIAALVMGEIVFIFVTRGAGGQRAPVTAAQEVIWKRDNCLLAMQGVRVALEEFRKRNNVYPDSLEEVKKTGVKASCPLTGAGYRYERVGSDYSLSCPNPEKHGVRQISSSGASVPHPEK